MDYDPTEPIRVEPPQPPQEKWVAKLRIDLTRVVGTVMTQQGPQEVVRGVTAQEETAEGATPGEAFRAAREKLKPLMKAYRLEGGPLPVEVSGRSSE